MRVCSGSPKRGLPLRVVRRGPYAGGCCVHDDGGGHDGVGVGGGNGDDADDENCSET